MKVLIVSQHFWPEEFQINHVAELLTKQRLTIDVLTGKPNYPTGQYFFGYHGIGCQYEQWNGINIYRIPLVARGKHNPWKLAINYLSFVLCGCILGPLLLRKKKYDVIFVYATSPILQAIPALFLGLLKRIKVIIWIQDLWPDSLTATGYIKNLLILRCVTKIVQIIYCRADLLLIQSKAFFHHIKKLVPKKLVKYYPNSADKIFNNTTDIAFKLRDNQILLQKNKFSVVFAGNLGIAQALDTIIDAADTLRHASNIVFYLFGTGNRLDWLIKEIKRRELKNVYLPGRLPMQQMPGLMRQASVLLVTLSTQPIFLATVPSKIQAYMAVGRPIIASLDGEGARLIKEAQAGIIVPAGNASALAQAVYKASSMKKIELEQLGKNGQAYFQLHFNSDKLIDQLITHFYNTI